LYYNKYIWIYTPVPKFNWIMHDGKRTMKIKYKHIKDMWLLNEFPAKDLLNNSQKSTK